MEGHLEAVLEMDFCTKPPNFGVEAHMEAPTGDALTIPSIETLSLELSNAVQLQRLHNISPFFKISFFLLQQIRRTNQQKVA
jgi:hypothetical protein